MVADDDICCVRDCEPARAGRVRIVGQVGDARDLLQLVRDSRRSWSSSTFGCRRPIPPKGLTPHGRSGPSGPIWHLGALGACRSGDATELLASGHKVGYLLKSRVTDVADFIDSLERIARGGSVVDPSLVKELVSASRRQIRWLY